MKLYESSSNKVAAGTAILAAGLLASGCGAKDPNAIKDCERGYTGVPVKAAGIAVRAFSNEAARVELRFKEKTGSPAQTPALIVAYDRLFNWQDWSGGANTVNQASKILCVERTDSGSELVLNDHAEAIRGVLQAAGIKFDLSAVIKVDAGANSQISTLDP